MNLRKSLMVFQYCFLFCFLTFFMFVYVSCFTAGGRAVIDAIQSALSLPDSAVEPSRYVLQRYGNTSSSSIWYEFEHIQTTKNIKKGQKIWQLGFGSGFKCNSAVWKKI